MEVLVLVDFEATTEDELTVQGGDVVKKVSKGKEDGWLEGELRGKRGMFPANFAKEIPVYLIGDNNREPRSLRKSKKAKPQVRKCEVTFAYTPAHEDELELVVGETVEILKEIEDGWWMGKKNNQIGAFPSNFVKEMFVPSKDNKMTEGKARPKLSEAVFMKEQGKVQQRPSIRKKTSNVKESCQVMFDYKAAAEDELDLKKGDVITIINKATEDKGWWEGELNGCRGFFPDNFIMLIPADTLHIGNAGKPPVRSGSVKQTDEKSDTKDFRTDPVGKIKLPGLHKPPVPPLPVKEKLGKLASKRNTEEPPASPKQPLHSPKQPLHSPKQPLHSPKQPLHSPTQPLHSPTQKEGKVKTSDQFDGVDVSSDKLIHPTANRAKPPQRRPPAALGAVSNIPAETHCNATSEKKDGLPQNVPDLLKVTEGHSIPPKTDQPTKSTSPPKPQSETKAVLQENPSLASVLTELQDLRKSLNLLKAQHEKDIQELKDELKDEREKRTRLQNEVAALRKK